MVVANPSKAGLILTAILLASSPVFADDSSNYQDGGPASDEGQGYPPCNILYVDIEYPYVDFHPECITLPSGFL